MFHVTPEGEAYKKGVNWWRAPGWVRLVFFCGDCRLYLRFRWSKTDPGSLSKNERWAGFRAARTWFAPRIFCHWDLRKDQEPKRYFRLEGNEFVPAEADSEEYAEGIRIEAPDGWKV